MAAKKKAPPKQSESVADLAVATVDQRELLTAAKLAAQASAKSTVAPILANILIRQHEDRLQLLATDMIVSVTASVACRGQLAKPIIVNARQFVELIGSLEAGEVGIDALENSWAKITTKASEFKLMGMSAGDFPDLPDSTKLDGWNGFTPATACAVISQVLYAASHDDSSPVLSAALIEYSGESISAVATDGHRLAQRVDPTNKSEAIAKGPDMRSMILPRRGLDQILRVCDGRDLARIHVGDHYVHVECSGITLGVRRTEGVYPPWRNVVPKSAKHSLTCDRQALIRALRQVTVFAPEKTAAIRMIVESGSITVASENHDRGTASVSIPAEASAKITIATNVRYLVEALDAEQGESVELGYSGPLDPITIQTPTSIALVMPMKI
jgi:DNA polymerase-3 subunit beta